MRALIVLLLFCAAPAWCAEVTDEQMEGALKTWRAYDMPEPPADAKLVALTESWVSYVNGVKQPQTSILAFRLPGDEPRYLVGAWVEGASEYRREDEVKNPDELDGAEVDISPWHTSQNIFTLNNALALGIQLWARGHKKLGREITGRSLELDTGHFFSRFWQTPADAPAKMLPSLMWARWGNLLVEPDTDRSTIYVQMKKAFAEFEELRGEHDKAGNQYLLDALRKALEPSNALPGSIEADIRALSEVCQNDGGIGLRSDRDPHYLAVLRRGFDVVPGLLEHLDDTALTRSLMVGFNNFPTYIRTRRELVGDILQAIAGRELERDWLDKQKGWSVDKDAATKWWNEAKELGEKKYFAKNMLGDFEDGPNPDTLELISTKYPSLLLDKYLDFVNEGEHPPRHITEFLAASRLPAEVKAKALRKGANAEDLDARWESLRALQEFDEEAYINILVETLDSFTERQSGKRYRAAAKASYSHLVLRTGNQAAWDALSRAAKRAETSLRVQFMTPMNYTYVGENYKEQRLRFLAAFADDEEVRDHACDKIGSILHVEGRPVVGKDADKWPAYRKAALAALKEFGIDPPEDE